MINCKIGRYFEGKTRNKQVNSVLNPYIFPCSENKGQLVMKLENCESVTTGKSFFHLRKWNGSVFI